MAAFQCGSCFYTFQEFSEALERFSTSSSTQFVKRTSTKIKDPALAHLELESATYWCKHGKASHASASTGARPNQKSCKIGCSASFRLNCVRPENGDVSFLRLSKADFTHTGHDVSSHMFSLYPERRRIEVTPTVETIAKTSLQASEVKSLVEQTLGNENHGRGSTPPKRGMVRRPRGAGAGPTQQQRLNKPTTASAPPNIGHKLQSQHIANDKKQKEESAMSLSGQQNEEHIKMESEITTTTTATTDLFESTATVKEEAKEAVELNTDQALSIERDNVAKFQQQQKVIEEANKQKRALLSKAIEERRKMAKAESQKLLKIQQELNHLDTLLNADVGIIRDRIEVASLDYAHAQKRYEKAEKEFIEAKMDLFEKSEAKEQLTEHLYTIINQNEIRKAKKLVELMEQLAMEVTPEELEMSIASIPHLTNFTAASTIHHPSHQHQHQHQPRTKSHSESESQCDGNAEGGANGVVEDGNCKQAEKDGCVVGGGEGSSGGNGAAHVVNNGSAVVGGDGGSCEDVSGVDGAKGADNATTNEKTEERVLRDDDDGTATTTHGKDKEVEDTHTELSSQEVKQNVEVEGKVDTGSSSVSKAIINNDNNNTVVSSSQLLNNNDSSENCEIGDVTKATSETGDGVNVSASCPSDSNTSENSISTTNEAGNPVPSKDTMQAKGWSLPFT